MGEALPQLFQADSARVHELTASYMSALEEGVLNGFDVGEDLACRIASEEVSEDEAEAVAANLGIEDAEFEE